MRRPWTPDLPLLLLFVAPILGSVVGAATLAKFAFPAGAAVLALWFAERDPARFVRLLLWTLMLSPGLRHFVDWYAGFSQTNPIMLTPYLVVLAATPTVSLYLLNGRRYTVEFILLIGPIIAALGMALSTGAVADSIVAGMRWLMPPLVALYICARADVLAQVREAVHRTFLLAMPLIALYGIVQFVDITPWDAYFMREAPINSIGVPKPFEVRVFATMNVAGTLATMLGTGMLLLLPTLRGVRWMGMLLGVAALLLTAQRAALGAFIVAVLIMALITQDRILRRSIAKVSMSVAIVFGILFSVPGAANKLMATVESVSELDQNDSAQVRWQQYLDLLPMLDENKLGRGLGWNSNEIYVNVGEGIGLDSGVIDIFVGLGLPGGMLFIVALGTLVILALKICRRVHDGDAAAEFCAVVFGLAQLPFGSQQTQEDGMFLYLALGMLLARAIKNAATSEQKMKDLTNLFNVKVSPRIH